MSAKLSTVNPYLRDPAQRRRSVLKSVASSSAIEGIHAPFKHQALGSSKSTITGRAKPAPKAKLTRSKS